MFYGKQKFLSKILWTDDGIYSILLLCYVG